MNKKNLFIYKILNLFLLIFIFTACSNKVPDIKTRHTVAEKIAIKNNFLKKNIPANGFILTIFERIIDKNLPFVFYIEKDGYAFTKYGPSDNPTPIKQMLFNLAAQDTNRNVVFITRPCQYDGFILDCNCKNNTYWTQKRLAKEVVLAINEIIVSYCPNKKFSLVGHSGGGSLAVLVAAFNKNTQSITTIAANLELDSFNSYHHVENSMLGSLNPTDYAKKLNTIPQLHLAGDLDTVVPFFIIKKYVLAANSKQVKMMRIKNASHNDGWENIWHDLLKTAK